MNSVLKKELNRETCSMYMGPEFDETSSMDSSPSKRFRLCRFRRDAQLSQRDRAVECVIFGQEWKTGTGRQ